MVHDFNISFTRMICSESISVVSDQRKVAWRGTSPANATPVHLHRACKHIHGLHTDCDKTDRWQSTKKARVDGGAGGWQGKQHANKAAKCKGSGIMMFHLCAQDWQATPRTKATHTRSRITKTGVLVSMSWLGIQATNQVKLMMAPQSVHNRFAPRPEIRC